eukprot:1182687-Prorocentrum_minimum.AAC.12
MSCKSSKRSLAERTSLSSFLCTWDAASATSTAGGIPLTLIAPDCMASAAIPAPCALGTSQGRPHFPLTSMVSANPPPKTRGLLSLGGQTLRPT